MSKFASIFYIAAVLAFSLVVSSGCAYVDPLISDFNIVSPATETQIGNQMQTEIKQQMEVVDSGSEVERIRRIGNQLVAQLPQRLFEYHFFEVNDKTPNAFTIPGATIYVHSGLLAFVGSDDELAGVLAHEIGHAYERHSVKALSRAYGLQYLSSLVFDPNSASKISQMVFQMTSGGILNRYSRDDERQADELAVYILRRTPYNQAGLLTFLEKLQKIQPSTPLPFLSTHPPTPERIARLKQLIYGQGAVSAPQQPYPSSLGSQGLYSAH